MNNKKFIRDIAVVVAGVFVLAFGYLYLSEKLPQVKKSNTVADETAGWKTYRNDRYNYEIMYPQNWFVKDMYPYPSRDGRIPIGQTVIGDIIIVSKSPISFGVRPDNQFVDKVIQELLNSNDYFTISHYSNSKMADYDNWILKDFSGGEGMFINPQLNTEIIGSNRVSIFVADNYPMYSYFIFNGKDVFEFVSRPSDSNSLIFKQVISSFKFIK